MPERFLPENRDSVKPYSYLPFGEGHRLCLGNRFAKMQAMTGLITLLKKYKVTFGPKTPKEVIISPRSISSYAVGGLWLSLETRPGWEERKYVKRTIDRN
ncbi:cytochrome P450 9e2-like [Hyposmocoma kahamanoa]|uniref:cytochrome P450 9e2-like n=1 Tax=Hyposmocoma kahamanoa TaxID=1477025 RepID=UPI000E6D937C|nr:cytochrome P450 9e2-like [Hyposmocoma kahamanoa]